MKVRVALRISSFQVIAGILSISWVSGQAPYPPSGYRPSGRQFELPKKRPGQHPPTNQYGAPPPRPPPNQYGAPANRPQVNIAPPDQYLPSLDPTFFRTNPQGQQDFLNQAPQTNIQVDQQQSFGQEQVGGQRQQQGYLGQHGQVSQQQQPNYIQQTQQQQGWAQPLQQTFSNQNQQGWAQSAVNDNGNQNFGKQQAEVSRQNFGIASLNRNPQQNSNQQRQSAKQLYQTNEQNDEENFTSNEDQDDDQDQSTRALNPNGQNYLPPTTTEGYLRKPTQRRRYPEPTTRRPETQEPEEPENDDPEDPNVAIATAIARGQYYLLQPDGRLQRVSYKTTQTQEDLKNNGFSARLIYQNVEPITAPIYSYNAPLVRIN